MSVHFIAHRAGNTLGALKGAEPVVGTVEVDLHLAPDRTLEARHSKRVWGTKRLWERWFLLPAGAVGVPFSDVREAAEPETLWWIDMKGLNPALPVCVAESMDQNDFFVSGKSWWMLGAFTGNSRARTFRSAGNRLELTLLLLRLLAPTRVDGAVVHSRLLSPRVVDRLRGKGEVYTWAANEVGTIERLALRGVDGFIVDDLGVIAAAEDVVVTQRKRRGH